MLGDLLLAVASVAAAFALVADALKEGLTEQQVKDINVFLGETTGGAGKVGKELDLEKMIRNDLKADNLAKSQGAAAADPEDPFADFETKLNVALPSRKNM